MSTSKNILNDLDTVKRLSYVYGVQGIMEESERYKILVFYSQDQDFYSSACKLACRFLCTAACVLISNISFEMKGLCLESKDISTHCEQLKELIKLL